IWVLDFKTDRVSAADAPAKAEVYRPQLEIYARALHRIYDDKPVKRRWVHFLSCGATIEV
ncbi:MAG TPA: hypothetical protein VK846_01695, partial [Candidatus Limnocylindria bacterium]|nr:hypothetical protein [Candidatus Limnocylindria bacterium]